MIRFAAAGCFALFLVPVLAAQTSQSAARKDPTAVSLIQGTLTAMGCGQALGFQDSLASGTAQVYAPAGTFQTFPIVKKTIGTTLTRTELQAQDGTHIRILNNGVAALVRPNGTSKRLIINNTVVERAQHIPCLSLLPEFQATNIDVQYVGTDTVNGDPASVVALSDAYGANADAISFTKSVTRTLFYISQTTGMVSKVQFQSFAENNASLASKEEIVFSNYSTVSGVAVPFIQSSYSDGALQVVITFTSVAFNAGISTSDFNLPTGN
jgi:hypothetical protein